jgi:hypothetical protein
LAAQCRAARAAGMDFPTIWHEILKANPLVVGPPVQVVHDGRPRLEINLISGGRLVFDSGSNEIAEG